MHSGDVINIFEDSAKKENLKHFDAFLFFKRPANINGCQGVYSQGASTGHQTEGPTKVWGQ